MPCLGAHIVDFDAELEAEFVELAVRVLPPDGLEQVRPHESDVGHASALLMRANAAADDKRR